MTARVSASVKLEVRPLDQEDVSADMVRVHQKYRRFSRMGQIILVRCNGRTLIAEARGAYSNQTGVVFLDQVSRGKLQVSVGKKVEFTFEKASLLDEVVWALSSTSALARITAQVAVLSAGLGLLGLSLGLIALFK